MSVAVVDIDVRPMVRASLLNQARLHNGYHYPRSAYTALGAARYYDRFVADFPEAINRHFRAIYAVASEGTYANAAEFEKFCSTVGVPVSQIDESEIFRAGTVEAAYETDEYGFDGAALRDALMRRIEPFDDRLEWYLADAVTCGSQDTGGWRMTLRSGAELHTEGIVNATYAGTNALLSRFGLEPLALKYELCELALVDAPAHRDLGITVMDGPFFSLMPFGHTGLHTLTTVDHTPRASSREVLPVFPCQSRNPECSPIALDNCGSCPTRPASSFPYMRALAGRFLNDVTDLRKVDSLNSIKVVLRESEVDDARPTLVRVNCEEPSFVTILGGKINTIYDLDDVL